MAESKSGPTQDQVPTVRESIGVVEEAVEGLLAGLGDTDSEAKDKVTEAQKLIDEARALEDAAENERKEAAGELRTTATDLEVQANELDPQSNSRFSPTAVRRVLIVGGAAIAAAIGISQMGGGEDKAPVNNGVPAPTQVTGATGQ